MFYDWFTIRAKPKPGPCFYKNIVTIYVGSLSNTRSPKKKGMNDRSIAIKMSKEMLLLTFIFVTFYFHRLEKSSYWRTRNLDSLFKWIKCGQGFKNNASMNYHMKYICGKKPSFRCNKCDHQTKRKHYLKMHLIKVHKVQPSELRRYDKYCGITGRIYLLFLFIFLTFYPLDCNREV